MSLFQTGQYMLKMRLDIMVLFEICIEKQEHFVCFFSDCPFFIL